PIVIRKEDREKYFDFISNNKVKEFAEYIKEQSNKELDFMLTLYEQICNNTFDNNVENDNFKKIRQ
ncbi:MAG TPA: hypothetical protein GX747_04780, partial [Tenericutes bacterium]|nr:hypothetical protein [Mycoplasmatota bacterium]